MFACNRTNGNGFHISFENGWTVSVQWGDGTYSEFRDAHGKNFIQSKDAEVAAWNSEGWWKFEEDTVQGYKSAAEVIDFANMISKLS